MFEHPAPPPDLLNGPQGQFALTRKRFRKMPESPPSATRRMRDHRTAAGPRSCVAVNVPYINAIEHLVDRITTSEEHGNGWIHGLARSTHALTTVSRASQEP